MPDPGLDNKPSTVNGETSRSHQKLSLRENVPFRPTFSGFNLHPAALLAGAVPNSALRAGSCSLPLQELLPYNNITSISADGFGRLFLYNYNLAIDNHMTM